MKLINEKEAAEALGVQPGTLRTWRSLGKGPPWAKIEGAIRYVDLDEWIVAQMVTPDEWEALEESDDEQ